MVAKITSPLAVLAVAVSALLLAAPGLSALTAGPIAQSVPPPDVICPQQTIGICTIDVTIDDEYQVPPECQCPPTCKRIVIKAKMVCNGITCNRTSTQCPDSNASLVFKCGGQTNSVNPNAGETWGGQHTDGTCDFTIT